LRITNKVMQNNALTNINRNKELQDNLTTQLSTGKKVNRPSEDPVVSIRALRLRSDVNQVSQFSKKNVPDANSWLELTESSISTTISVVKDMVEKCEKGSNDTLTTSDRQIIIDSLKELRNEVYATGDADYAGRYIFTGYRTDTPLTFPENTNQTFSITELFSAEDLQQMTYIDTDNLLDLSEVNFDNAGAAAITEQTVEPESYYRIRLSYDNLDAGQTPSAIKLGNNDLANITIMEDKAAAYKAIQGTSNTAIMIPSTGELIMSEDLYNQVKDSDEKVSFTYDKSTWKKGDLQPEHYFYCETDNGKGGTIKYNEDYLDSTKESYGKVDQGIEYQVGFNQSIRVNTPAGDVYQHAIGRDVDEIIDLANYLTDVENMQEKLKGMASDTENYSSDQITNIEADLKAADKAVAYLKDELQKRFSKYITSMQSYLDGVNSALTTVGSRSSRLELISNRLDDQTTTFKTLQSENEDADATEVAVQLSSAQVSYQAALMATGDMIKETLLNYL